MQSLAHGSQRGIVWAGYQALTSTEGDLGRLPVALPVVVRFQNPRKQVNGWKRIIP